MQFSGRFSLISSRIVTNAQGQSLALNFLDIETGSRIGAFVPVKDPLGQIPQGTILRMSGNLRHNDKYLNASDIHFEEDTP